MIRDAVAAFNERRREGLGEILQPEIEIRRPFVDLGTASARSFGGVWRGLDAVERVTIDLTKGLGGFSVAIRSMSEAPSGNVLAELIYRIGPEDEPTHQIAWALYGFRDGLISSFETFSSEEAARAASGERRG